MSDRQVKCAGCGSLLDIYDCTRTWANDRWFFFCRTCEHDDTRIDVLKKVNHGNENKSGAA